MKKGLLIVHTGHGKGKTTAALGMALRTLGHNLPVCIIQFIKGTWKYGELVSLKRFEDLLDIHVMGKGFTWKSIDLEKDREYACKGWEMAKSIITANKHHLVILDELTYLITYKMIDEDDVIDCLKNKPKDLHVIVTGRDASEKLIDIADLVTEMCVIKHPLKDGIKAQKGIEF
jgi:cob(I)alamin adenosyltransferase